MKNKIIVFILSLFLFTNISCATLGINTKNLSKVTEILQTVQMYYEPLMTLFNKDPEKYRSLVEKCDSVLMMAGKFANKETKFTANDLTNLILMLNQIKTDVKTLNIK